MNPSVSTFSSEPPSFPEQFKKNNPGTAWFRGKFLLDLIRQCKTIEINLCKAVNFSMVADLSGKENTE